MGPTIAAAIFSGFWTWLFGLALGQILIGGLLGGGPIGVVVAGITIAAGPSYRKTIPAGARPPRRATGYDPSATPEASRVTMRSWVALAPVIDPWFIMIANA